MYNRYVPQPDGSYRRNRMQDISPIPARQPSSPPSPPPLPEPRKDPEPAPCSSCIHHAPPRRPIYQREIHRQGSTSVTGFLKQLLPKDFDVEDLLVVLLLLLMAGDCQENQNTALLTLVLYLFL